MSNVTGLTSIRLFCFISGGRHTLTAALSIGLFCDSGVLSSLCSTELFILSLDMTWFFIEIIQLGVSSNLIHRADVLRSAFSIKLPDMLHMNLFDLN